MPDIPSRSAPDLPPDLFALVSDARRATLATIRPDGSPRLVPICFVVAAVRVGGSGQDAGRRLLLWSPLDEKPKRTDDPRGLARVRDIRDRPRVEVLVDRWDEDWGRLAWVRLGGMASLIEPADRPDEHAGATARLRSKYPQYERHDLESRPLLRIGIDAVRWWRPAVTGSAEGSR